MFAYFGIFTLACPHMLCICARIRSGFRVWCSLYIHSGMSAHVMYLCTYLDLVWVVCGSHVGICILACSHMLVFVHVLPDSVGVHVVDLGDG